MPCETCLLEQPEVESLALATLAERLERCDGCPHIGGPGRVLVRRLRESATAVRRAINQARKAELELAELNKDVARYESRISVLESTQKAALLEVDADLRDKAEKLEHKQAELLAVSTPILAVWDGIVVAPLIGHIDAERARRLQENLLETVRASRARRAILDLTGVSEVDAATADNLLQIARAVRLLGAEVILTGLRPDIARMFVDLDVDLSGLRTIHALQDALQWFLAAPSRPRVV